jgi:cytosine/adenosine deaminase-related metal-dependent hydrolase
VEGAKADIVIVDATHPAMCPVRDPIRSLTYAAADRAVRDVFVDGLQVVENGEVVTMDHAQAARDVQAALDRAQDQVPVNDWAGRTAQDISPATFPFG